MSEFLSKLLLTVSPCEAADCAEVTGEAVYAAVTGSDLVGRGYKGLPAAEKWRSLAEQEGEKEIVCLISGDCANALFEVNPSAVLCGTALAARAFGCEKAYIVRDGALDIPETLLDIRLLPFAIAHSGSSGEETRVFAAIEGDIPITRPQPPYPTEKGLFGRPTLIHSAEFFACLPYLMKGESCDTKLIKLCGDVEKPGFYEVRLGTPISELIPEAKAVQLGGGMGKFYTPGNAGAVRCEGDGSIKVIGSDKCMARICMEALEAVYPGSCGRCVFCREGLYQLYLLMKDLCAGRASDGDVALIKDIAAVIAENAACDYGKSAGEMVLSAFALFGDELEAHTRGKCKTLRCPGMFTAHVLPDKCTGCGDCLNRCPKNAIAGGEGLIHVIDQDLCDQCMKCLPCKADAIGRAGMLKPACPTEPVPVGSFVQKKKGLQKRGLKK